METVTRLNRAQKVKELQRMIIENKCHDEIFDQKLSAVLKCPPLMNKDWMDNFEKKYSSLYEEENKRKIEKRKRMNMSSSHESPYLTESDREEEDEEEDEDEEEEDEEEEAEEVEEEEEEEIIQNLKKKKIKSGRYDV